MKKLTVAEAAKILGMSEQCVRIGLIRQKLPIGYAVKLKETNKRYNYYINPKLLKEYIGDYEKTKKNT